MSLPSGESRAPRRTGTPIIILGADRSGTSLVAELVSCWGAWGGEAGDLARADRWNPRGYFEHRGLTAFLAELTAETGLNPWHPEFPRRCREQAENPELRGKAESLVAAMAGRDRAWFWKEPKLSALLPFWQRVWGEAVYIIALRNPYDSVCSLERMRIPAELRERISLLGANLLLWQHSMHDILTGTEGTSRKIFVSYDELLRAPHEECRRLSTFLDREGRTLGGEERSERMAAIVRPELRHYRSAQPFEEVEEATRSQKDLYEFLLAKRESPEAPYVAARYPIYPGGGEYLDTLHLFSRFYGQAGPLIRSPFLRALAWTERQAFGLWRRAVGFWPRAGQVR
jgi:hypothetical protein